MLNELKILFDNIKHFRHLITEGVGADSIIPHIQNHEWIYINYAGDDKVASGYRTIRPYVVGTSKAGNPVLRAWQDNPKNSWHFDNKPTRPITNPDHPRNISRGHDYWVDNEGEKPGWRMFLLSNITSVYPMGQKFNDSNGNVMIPAGYHEGADKDMTHIDAYVSTKNQPDFVYQYDREYTGDTQTRKQTLAQRWDSIRRGNAKSKKITAADVTKLADMVSRVIRKKRSDFLVAIDDKGNYRLLTPNDKRRNNIPDTAIVGSLAYLYDSLIKGNEPAEDSFFNDTKTKVQADLEQQKKKEMETGFATIQEIDKNLPKIPFERKPFFKQ